MPGINLLTVDEALSLSNRDVIKFHKDYLNASLVEMLTLIKFTKQFVKAEGLRVWDSDGNEYLDFLGGYGSLNLGHNHPKVLAAIEKAGNLPNLIQASLNTLAGALAYNLSQITPGKLQRSFFCNSGAEAVEGALKLARIATGKTKIISAENSFHGKSFGALTATGRKKYQDPFQPLVPDFYYFPFGDASRLEDLLKGRDVAAVILEPIQGEGGIIVPPPGFLTKARKLCNEYEALLIMDEIQTGFGRTGKMFACQYEEVEPDIMCLAKSLGGGIMPIGAYIATDTVWRKGYGSATKATIHSSTFGGNTLACAAGLATIQVIVEEDLASKAAEQGNCLMEKLLRLKSEFPFIKEVRGQGLFIGIKFNPPQGVLNSFSGGMLGKVAEEYTGAMVAGELMNKHRIITAFTLNNPNVIRLEPPLAITKTEIDYLVNALHDIFTKNKGFLNLAVNMGKNLLRKN